MVDALEGNDRFFIRSTNENVALELVGGMGSDTFNVGGGNGGNAITVVSNSLGGHSGLIVNTVSSDDPAYKNIFVQDISANVADNDEPGVVVDLLQSHLLVFEESADNFFSGPPDPRAGLITATYRIVLTRSPTESVRVTAAAVPLREGEIRAGAKAAAWWRAPSVRSRCRAENGVSLLSTAITGSSRRPSGVRDCPTRRPRDRRFINIQHTVIQGRTIRATVGEVRRLIIPGVTVEVIDDDVARWGDRDRRADDRRRGPRLCRRPTPTPCC